MNTENFFSFLDFNKYDDDSKPISEEDMEKLLEKECPEDGKEYCDSAMDNISIDRLTLTKNFHHRVQKSADLEDDYEIIIDALSDVLGQTPEYKMLSYIVGYVFEHRIGPIGGVDEPK
jgi:hypothetical protein